MRSLEPKFYNNVQGGLVTESSVSKQLVPDYTVVESVNFNFDVIGEAQLRKGTTLLGNALSGNVLGLYQFVDTVGSNSQLLMANGSSVFALTGGTWSTTVRSGLTAAKARYVSFLNFVFMVNGADAMANYAGTGTFSAVQTNVSGAPVTSYLETFRSRLWAAGSAAYPDRLYYSSLPSAVATPIITWNTSATTGNWIDISPQDGDIITGLKRTKLALLVFKRDHIYNVYSVTQTEPDPKINVGTYSQESIVEAKDGMYFHHGPSGFYILNDAGLQEISRPIIDAVVAIPRTAWANVVGWLEADGDHVCWSVGTITIGVNVAKQRAYTNVVLRYTISAKVWTMSTYPTQFMASGKYDDGSTLYRLCGDTAGKVYQMDTGKTDNGTAILYSLIHNWFTVDGSRSSTKTIDKTGFIHLGGAGTKVGWQDTESPDPYDFKPLAQFGIFDTVSNTRYRGRELRLHITGSSTGEPFKYGGYEILEGKTEIIQQK